jgi:hypothetical protein
MVGSHAHQNTQEYDEPPSSTTILNHHIQSSFSTMVKAIAKWPLINRVMQRK